MAVVYGRMLWTLFEHGNWTDLSVLLERMRKAAAVYGDDDRRSQISIAIGMLSIADENFMWSFESKTFTRSRVD